MKCANNSNEMSAPQSVQQLRREADFVWPELNFYMELHDILIRFNAES